VFSIVLIEGIFYVKIRKLFLFAKEKNVMVSLFLIKAVLGWQNILKLTINLLIVEPLNVLVNLQ